ncbi:MAG: MFS transporter [Proteobacteria bacterium]|nr:MFS transporter [Pseudomonadota bacterium]
MKKNFRWTIIGLIFTATIINYLDRSALSYAITPIKNLFHLSDASFGFIASGFGIGYLVMTIGGGILVDRFGAGRVWTFAAILWSVVSIFMGLAAGFTTLMLLRILLGVAEGPAFPALSRAIADWLPSHERATAFGIGLCAVPLASVIGAPLISSLILTLGWRWMFVVLGILGIIWTVIWVTLFRDRPKDSPHVSAEELKIISESGTVPETQHRFTTRAEWRFILLDRSLLANNFAFFSFGYLLFFALSWLPGYFEQTFGVHLNQLAVFLIAPWLLATILILVGGRFSDYMWQKTKNIRKARSHIIWICQIISAICFIPVILTNSLTIALVFITLGIAIGLMPNAAFYAINTDLARERAGTALGVMDAAFALGGILAPSLTGLISHVTGSFNSAFILMIVLTILSALGIIFFQKPETHD